MVEDMKVREGYKRTEVGVIPEDWEVVSLNEITSSINDGTHYTPKYVEQGVSFYSVESVTNNDFINTKYISKEEHNLLIRRCKPEKGDILLTRIGTLGQTKLIDWNVDASIYVSLGLLKINDKIDRKYFYRYTKSNMFVQNLEKRSLLNAIPKKINMDQIGYITIPKPPLKEQKAIAKILTDTDNLIQSIEKLIDKKEKIKKGTMQELLTGKKRLDGFSGEWENDKLGNIVINISSGTSKTKSNKGKYKVYGSTGVIGYNNFYDYTGDSILVARVGANAGKVGLGTGKYCVSDNALIINYDNNIDLNFLYYYLINFRLNRLVFGSGQPLITGAQLKKISVSLAPLAEQQAIAQILSDMDQEIETLKEKLEKYKTIKQGMMQELLTGRIRLI